MTYQLETDVLVNWLQGRQHAVELIQQLAPAGLAISLITYGEVYDGVYHGCDPQQRERDFLEFLRYVDVLSLTRPIMQRFASERGRLRQRGRSIADMDLLIGVTALHHGLVLVTRNARHFERVTGLELYPVDAT